LLALGCSSSSDVGDAGADADADADTDADADADTDADTDSDTDDCWTDECPVICPCVEAELAAEEGECAFPVDWEAIPESSLDPPYTPITKACINANAVAITADSEELRLHYLADCAGESAEAGYFGWRWAGLEVACEDLESAALDACAAIELCPAACAARWDGGWSGAEVQVGCASTAP
jgi:hypothetical protein